MSPLSMPSLCLLLLVAGSSSVASAQLQDAFVEGLREIMHQLVSNGNPITPEALSAVADSFTGLEKDIAMRFHQRLSGVNEPDEVVLQETDADLQTFQDLLFNVKAIGGVVKPALAAALLNVLGDAAQATLEPTVSAWKKANAVTLNAALKSSIKSANDVNQEVVNNADGGSVVERLMTKIPTLPNSMAKSTLSNILKTIEKLMKLQGSASQFSVQPDADVMLMENEIELSIEQVDKVLNREFFQFLSTAVLKMTKAQARDQVERLTRNIYDDKSLPVLLQALQVALK